MACSSSDLIVHFALFFGFLHDTRTQAEGDLLPEELTDIWRTAPKFPDGKTRIDVDSFVQIYRDVDDLFEEEEEEGSPTEDVTATISDDDETDKNEDTMEAELETVFITICDKDSLIAKDNLKKWDEIQKLLSEGLLGEDEFDQIWEETPKSPGSNRLDVDGFLSFNVALDGLFEFDDDDLDEDIVQNEIEEDTQPVSSAPKAMKMVDGDDLPPGVLFAALADDEYMVGMDELKCWRELQEWLEDGDLLPLELQTIYERHVSSGSEKLNEDSFVKLYNDIDSLFEEVEDDDQQKEDIMSQNEQNQRSAAKEDLIDLISIIDEESENLPCGLDATERDQKQILNIVSALEEDPTNLIRQKSGTIEMEDVSGTWELMYSSSSAMKFNKGLSGLGGSFPNGKFAGLKQRLQASKYMTDLEYIERIEVTPSTASFDVRVDGGWELRTSVSLFTGQPSTVLYVEPDKVTYGPVSHTQMMIRMSDLKSCHFRPHFYANKMFFFRLLRVRSK